MYYCWIIKNILAENREGCKQISKIALNVFSILYMIFIEPSMDIILNYQDFCQWYLTVYSFGIIILCFWIIDPLFLKEKDFNDIKTALFYGFLG